MKESFKVLEESLLEKAQNITLIEAREFLKKIKEVLNSKSEIGKEIREKVEEVILERFIEMDNESFAREKRDFERNKDKVEIKNLQEYFDNKETKDEAKIFFGRNDDFIKKLRYLGINTVEDLFANQIPAKKSLEDFSSILSARIARFKRFIAQKSLNKPSFYKEIELKELYDKELISKTFMKWAKEYYGEDVYLEKKSLDVLSENEILQNTGSKKSHPATHEVEALRYLSSMENKIPPIETTVFL